MAYTTPQLLIERFGANSVAQLSTARLSGKVDANLLLAMIEGEDLSSWTAEQQALAANAIEWIEARIEDAALKVDSYISGRYQLPLTLAQIQASTIPENTEVLCFYAMKINGADEATQKRYDEAIRWLKDVSRGFARIGGVIEAEAVQVDQRRLTRKAPSAVDWSNYP